MANSPERIAAIVPAYNEENQLGAVLKVLTRIDEIDEIIVVNDGSIDQTSAVARSYGVKVIDKEVNAGKGAAMQTGINSTDADILLFIDADLLGLEERHIRDLLNPLISDKKLMMTVGRFVGGRLATDLAQALVPTITGQRAVRRAFFEGLSDLSDTGFGVEIAITQHARRQGYKVEEVLISEVSQVMKEEKLGKIAGFRARLKMYADILKQIARNSKKK
ncbi:MAG: glycosyltransferase family 2 protein [Firmicutes bacterium]|nr:glycosyltransferase family 2 protein [Bacillota bacterium]